MKFNLTLIICDCQLCCDWMQKPWVLATPLLAGPYYPVAPLVLLYPAKKFMENMHFFLRFQMMDNHQNTHITMSACVPISVIVNSVLLNHFIKALAFSPCMPAPGRPVGPGKPGGPKSPFRQRQSQGNKIMNDH